MKYKVLKIKRKPWWRRHGIKEWDVFVELEDGRELRVSARGAVPNHDYLKLDVTLEIEKIMARERGPPHFEPWEGEVG